VDLNVLGALIFVINGFGNLNIFSERTVGSDFLKILVSISSVYVLFSEFVKGKA
jgi:hypothetical protein